LVNCLNFGNPEHAEVMWQFAEVVDGMSEACEHLRVPVIGGNVSFYNESRGADIHPTPVVGVVGLIEDLTSVPPPVGLEPGRRILALGVTATELGGSEWAARHGLVNGRPPAADLAAGASLCDVVRALVNDRVVSSVHDCSEGGLAVALAEMAVQGAVGFRVDLARAPGDVELAAACFAESANRVVVASEASRVDEIVDRARGAGVAVAELGESGGARLVADGAFDVSLADATHAWRDAIPNALGVSTAR
jgi:phosphoribosylformylglycinamidine synthase